MWACASMNFRSLRANIVQGQPKMVDRCRRAINYQWSILAVLDTGTYDRVFTVA